MTTRITLKEAAPHFAKLAGRQREAALRGLRSAAMRGVQLVVAEIIPSRTPQPVDRGVYRAGWRWEPTPEGAVVENLEPHAAVVERGARSTNVKPGRQMIAALQEWARRKGLEDPESAAWAIARAMQRRGIFGDGLRVLAELNERLPAIVEEEVGRELRATRGKRGGDGAAKTVKSAIRRGAGAAKKAVQRAAKKAAKGTKKAVKRAAKSTTRAVKGRVRSLRRAVKKRVRGLRR